MKLSTRSRYGTRMMVDLAQHYDEGPVRIGSIAKRQDVSVKYLEQLVIPMKKANFIKSVRGPRGGHMLSRPPEEITIGEIVNVFEGGTELSECVAKDDSCDRSSSCLVRGVWKEATRAMHDKLNSMTLLNVIEKNKGITEEA